MIIRIKRQRTSLLKSWLSLKSLHRYCSICMGIMCCRKLCPFLRILITRSSLRYNMACLIKTISIHLDELKNYSSFGNKLYIKLINTYPKLNSMKKNLVQTAPNVTNIINTNSFANSTTYRASEQNNYYKPKAKWKQ